MNWIYLFAAGIFEVAWAIGLKYTHGFTRFWPSVYTLSTMAVSIFLLSLAVRTLPIGTAYAVWTGIGAVGTAIIGIFFLAEQRDAMRIICLFMIIIGIVGLKLFHR